MRLSLIYKRPTIVSAARSCLGKWLWQGLAPSFVTLSKTCMLTIPIGSKLVTSWAPLSPLMWGSARATTSPHCYSISLLPTSFLPLLSVAQPLWSRTSRSLRSNLQTTLLMASVNRSNAPLSTVKLTDSELTYTNPVTPYLTSLVPYPPWSGCHWSTTLIWTQTLLLGGLSVRQQGGAEFHYAPKSILGNICPQIHDRQYSCG